MNTSADSGATIAVVTRHCVARDCILRLLRIEPGVRQVRAYSTAHEAVEGFAGEPPELLILDLERQAATDGEDDWPAALNASRVIVLDPAPGGELNGMDPERTVSLDKDRSSLDELVHCVRRALSEGMDGRHAVMDALSARELQVLSFLAVGADNLKIAAHLGVCERTVKAHVSSLYRKLGQENRAQLALLAHEAGLRPPEAA